MDHVRQHAAARRRARTPAVLMAVVALVAGGAIGGCGGGGEHRAAPSPAATTFIDLVAALPSDLDPSATVGGPAFEALETSLAGTLVRPVGAPPGAATLASPERITGYLARSWTERPDGDYVFRLRAGVRSAYGHVLTAADVRFSFERELALSPSARALARLAGIDASDPVTTLGPLALRLNVAGHNALVLAVVAGFRFGILDGRAVLAHATADDPRARDWLARHLAFYGAYELQSFVPDVRLLLTANPRWQARLAFSHVAVEADPSAPLRLADVGAREASHTAELGSATFAAATRTNGLSARLMPSTLLVTLVPNERVAPLSRVAVRRALSLALDRRSIASAPSFAGIARPALWPVPSATPLGTGVVAPVSRHDLALARRLLAAAGYPRGFRLTLAGTRADGPQTAAALALVARDLRPLGIAVTWRVVASDLALTALMRDGGAGGALLRSAAPIASVPVEVAACCLPGSPDNLGGYEHPGLSGLVASAVRGDPGARRAAEQRALDTLAATVPRIPLVEIPSQNVTLAEIEGYAGYATQATYYDRLRK